MSRCAIVTGASRGIGRAASQILVDEGYSVVNISRSLCNVEGVHNLAIDMSEPGALEANAQAVLTAVNDAEQICLVHNAAMLLKDTTANIDTETFRQVLELNVIAPATLNKLLLPLMGAGSSIIYIASTLGQKAVSNSCSYVTSKHALIGLMKSTCQDLVGTSVHTLAICPGFTDTEMLRSHIGTDPAVEASIAETIAMGRLARPEEIAQAILFGATNPVLNGAVIDANLGQIER